MSQTAAAQIMSNRPNFSFVLKVNASSTRPIIPTAKKSDMTGAKPFGRGKFGNMRAIAHKAKPIPAKTPTPPDVGTVPLCAERPSDVSPNPAKDIKPVTARLPKKAKAPICIQMNTFSAIMIAYPLSDMLAPTNLIAPQI